MKLDSVGVDGWCGGYHDCIASIVVVSPGSAGGKMGGLVGYLLIDL